MVSVIDKNLAFDAPRLSEKADTLWSVCPALLESKDFVFMSIADASEQDLGQITIEKNLVFDAPRFVDTLHLFGIRTGRLPAH